MQASYPLLHFMYTNISTWVCNLSIGKGYSQLIEHFVEIKDCIGMQSYVNI